MEESDALKKMREKSDREDNERCFLPRKEKVKYRGIILMEIFHLEDFQKLKKGLDKLYKNLREFKREQINYPDLINDSPNRLFEKNWVNLPDIHHIKYKGKIITDGVFFDLGDSIDGIGLALQKISPSMITLQIHIYSVENVSSQIDSIIYKYHRQERKKQKDGEKIIYPDKVKAREITVIRNEFKRDAIELISKYLAGYFLSSQKPETIPSIDIISMRFNIGGNELIEWGNKFWGFFDCFNVRWHGYNCSKWDEYVLCKEDTEENAYKNLVIFADEERADGAYETIDNSIKYKLKYVSFDLFAIYRWLEMQQRTVGELNSTVSQELKNLKTNQIEGILSNRKEALDRVFQIERFELEFEEYRTLFEAAPFVNVADGTMFFENTKNGISQIIKKISAHTRLYDKHSNEVLKITEIETNNGLQTSIKLLTAIMVILMIIQIFMILDWSKIGLLVSEFTVYWKIVCIWSPWSCLCAPF